MEPNALLNLLREEGIACVAMKACEAELAGEPECKTALLPEFQRLWEACVGLSEKADFKAVFRHLERLEADLASAREQAELHHAAKMQTMGWWEKAKQSNERLTAVVGEVKDGLKAALYSFGHKVSMGSIDSHYQGTISAEERGRLFELADKAHAALKETP